MPQRRLVRGFQLRKRSTCRCRQALPARTALPLPPAHAQHVQPGSKVLNGVCQLPVAHASGGVVVGVLYGWGGAILLRSPKPHCRQRLHARNCPGRIRGHMP